MKKQLINILIVVLAVTIGLLILKKCDGAIEENHLDSDSIKKVISEQYEKRIDSLKAIKQKDSVRIEYVDRWRGLKHDTAYLPCDSLLPKIVNLCDSIIYVDSSQIATMKNVIAMDDSIINNYKKVAYTDSITIIGLNKEVKKHKKQKKIFAGIAAVVAGIAILK